jgi:hypothetical protein
MITAKQLRLAADMIDKRGFTLKSDASEDQLAAASFVFDNGLLMVGGPKQGEILAETRKILRAKADEMDLNNAE